MNDYTTLFQSNSDKVMLECISSVFHVSEDKIMNFQCLKAGMTNKSYSFNIADKHYIFRAPGAGTSSLINRNEEKASYTAVASLNITEAIFYFDGNTGYKIAEYYNGSRNACSDRKEDIISCMQFLKRFHDAKIIVDHSFDIWERIEFYESLCSQHNGIHLPNYDAVRIQMKHLMDRLNLLHIPQQLSHIDSIFDNFLILEDKTIRLIDWEYSGMCDPLIDIAMCAIYSYFDIEKTEFLMECYFERASTEEEKIRVYSYMALAGFLWALWTEYKHALGEDFGDYMMITYQYAIEYFGIVESMI